MVGQQFLKLLIGVRIPARQLMKLIFIRHGQTELNTAGLTHKPGSEIGLDEVGRKQAKKTAIYCQSLSIDTLYSSPEQRAIETATVIGENIHLSNTISAKLKERDWGDWNGKPWEEIKAVLDTKTLHDRYTFIPPNGESWEQMELRMKSFLDEVIKESHKCVAIVTHGGALRGLMPILTNKPLDTSLTYDFANASITIFNYADEEYSDVLVNSVAHLQ